MKPSTTRFIAYDLRPSKQAERLILLAFLKSTTEAGLSIADHRYVGMGGKTFYDFHLMHRFLGINRMISLERDPDAHKRCVFNCPFDFIKVKNTTTADFLATDRDERKTIYWFDYDDGIGPEITADIMSLGTRVKLGGFAFVTVYADPPGILERQTTQQRLDYFQQEMGEFSTGMTIGDMENAAFPTTINRLLIAAFKNAFAGRTEGQFQPLFQVQYKDSSPMLTVGGFFCKSAEVPNFVNRLEIDLPFLISRPPYKIRHLNLTERERALLDLAVTKESLDSKQANSLRAIGFRKPEFDAYRELIRFWPRYHEAII